MSRKETMKVYHGIPKSITDEHTIFYASLDGTVEPEIGNLLLNTVNPRYKPSPIGYSMCYYNDGSIQYKLNNTANIYNGFNIDFWINISKYRNISANTWNLIFAFNNSTNNRMMAVYTSGNNKHLYIELVTNVGCDSIIISPKFNELSDDCHIRISSDGKTLKTYCNGINISSYPIYESKNHKDFISFTCGIQSEISDIHISDIDRGDYFPNLPQDFIDGKAIIKPRMGQQQIKGDPLYSQRTLDRVSIGININEPQITCSRTSGDWTGGDTIKVKGLNGEIISGVIDTDTALFRSLEPEPFKPGSTGTIRVDNTNGVEVGDLVKRVNLNDYTTVRGPYTVSAVDTSNNTVTLSGLAEDGGTNLSYKYFFIEVTPSSSSPVVKTEDGIDVLGTWTALGSNEPTFTLGDNTNIAGKDLYIEYSLIIPSNNSDFPELPYGIEKAWTENGVEMKTVDEIIITDDFKGKIIGSMKECPHYSGYSATNQLSSLSEFTEHKQEVYKNIGSLDNNLGSVYNCMEENNISQHLIVFDLIEIIERKFGCEIPSINKIQWIEENVIKISINHYGYGEGPNGNKIYMKVLNNGQWVGDVNHNASTTTSKIFSWTGSGGIDNIDGGKVSFLVYTDASDGTTPSTIYTDYISIEITLKVDSAFATLYCKNTRAREDKCNPVLMQKETKTVKRYLPSKECFTTECRYVDQKGISISTSKIYTVLFELPSVYITTQGTGSYNSIANDFAKNCLSFLGISSTYKYCNEDISDFDVSGYSYKTTRFNQVPTVFYYNGIKYIPSKLPDRVLNVATLYPCIVNYNGEIYLHLSIITYVNKVRDTISYYLYPITNRPLLK